jgi:uncharacterized membrane protein YhfC
MILFLLALNSVLMIVMPILLGWVIARRLRQGWRLFLIGAGTFLLSQVGHLPFNYFFFGSLQGTLEDLGPGTQLLVTAGLLGLSAGVFEEGARYLTYRYWARDARSWPAGLMLGAGHGGVEAIVLGVLTGINLVVYAALQSGGLRDAIPADQLPEVEAGLAAILSIPWYEALLGAVERFFALAIQISLSLLVLRVFTSGRIIWLLVAVLWHAAVDAAAVVAVQRWGALPTEAIVGLMAIVSVLAIRRLRQPDPAPESPPPLPPLQEIVMGDDDLTAEKIEASRFHRR